jgi:hypothetical protein
MYFELKHNNSQISSTELRNEFYVPDHFSLKNRTAVITDKTLLTNLTKRFPEEKQDLQLISLHSADKVHYVSLFGMHEDGELPDDLTPTEMLLTRLLWGEVDRYIAVLCVAALEDMSVEDVEKSLQKMNLF